MLCVDEVRFLNEALDDPSFILIAHKLFGRVRVYKINAFLIHYACYILPYIVFNIM